MGVGGILLLVSVLIGSSLLLVAFAYFIFWLISEIYSHCEKIVKAKRNKCNVISSFDVPEYRKRREKLLLEIEQERQTEPKYHVTLWFGLRGLRDNGNGKYEWINRTPENITYKDFRTGRLIADLSEYPYPQYCKPVYDCEQRANTATFEQLRNEQMVQSNQDTINNLKLQSAQQAQNQRLINAVSCLQYVSVMSNNVYPVYAYNPACYVSAPCIPTKTIR